MSDVYSTSPVDSLNASPVGSEPFSQATAHSSSGSNQSSFDQWAVPSLTSESKEFAMLNTVQQEELVQQIFESAREQGKQKGFQEGYSEGIQHSRSETATVIDALQSFKMQLENPLKQIDKTVIDTMVRLAIDLAEKITRSEINRQPELIVQQLDQALDTLLESSVDVSVRMNPQDAQTVSTTFMEDNTRYQQLNIIEDKNIERGDCCLTTSISSVESTVRGKLKQMSEQLVVLLEEGPEHG